MPDYQVLDHKAQIRVYPRTLLPEEKVTKSKSLLVGDLHGNALKLLYILKRHQFIDITDKDYNDFVEIYDKNPKALTREDIIKFNRIIENITISEDAGQLQFLGDLLADRGQNDYFTLLMLKKLHHGNMIKHIIYSNHDETFFHYFFHNEQKLDILKDDQNWSGWVTQPGKFFQSMEHLVMLMRKFPGLVEEGDISAIISECYKPHVKLIGFEIDHESKTISFSTHAPALFLLQLEALMRKYGLADDIQNAGDLERVVKDFGGLEKTIDRINQRCKEDSDNIFVPTDRDLQDPFKRLLYARMSEVNGEGIMVAEDKVAAASKAVQNAKAVGNTVTVAREEKRLEEAKANLAALQAPIAAEFPKELFGYKVSFVHGHDTVNGRPHASLFDNIVNVDNGMGKSLKGRNVGELYATFITENLTLAKQLEKTENPAKKQLEEAEKLKKLEEAAKLKALEDKKADNLGKLRASYENELKKITDNQRPITEIHIKDLIGIFAVQFTETKFDHQDKAVIADATIQHLLTLKPENKEDCEFDVKKAEEKRTVPVKKFIFTKNEDYVKHFFKNSADKMSKATMKSFAETITGMEKTRQMEVIKIMKNRIEKNKKNGTPNDKLLAQIILLNMTEIAIKNNTLQKIAAVKEKQVGPELQEQAAPRLKS